MNATKAALALCLTLAASARASEPIVLDSTPAARQPQLAVGTGKRVAVAFGQGNTIRCSVSTDGGQTFGDPVVVGSLPTMALGMRRGPRIAITDDALIVAAVGGQLGGGKDGDVMAWRSQDNGRTWSGPKRINTVEASAREGLHALTARPDGTVFAAWLDLRDGTMRVYGAKSNDSGASWEPDHLVYKSPDRAICPCCHPSAAFAPDGSLFVMLRNDLAGARDMYLLRSSDNGDTFSNAEKLGRKTWILDRCPMDGGSIAPGLDSQPFTAWTRADHVYLAQPGQPERRLGPGAQPWAVPAPDGVITLWLHAAPAGS